MTGDGDLGPSREASWLGQAVRRLRDGLDADRALQGTMAGFIEAARSRYALDPGATWRPGEPLELLFAGYSGSRNTGADVRVEEMLRQFRHLLGDDHATLSVLTIDPALTAGYFPAVRQIHLPQVYPRFLYETVHRHHGVVACEGSMFKSKFANALSTLMVGALGLAAAEGKPAIAYGGEAGAMDPSLEALVRRYLREGTFVVTRNEQSRAVLRRLGVESRAGTDTAWTFDPAPPEVGRDLLRRAGWDGTTPVLAVCPINAFWWPVRPDVLRGAFRALAGGRLGDDESHYKSIYFHADTPEIRQKQSRYVDALAEAVRRTTRRHRVFPILIGMEQLDRRACDALASALGTPEMPRFVSDEHDMYTMVSVVRQARALVSSRYHALVCSMPALVPSVGVTMDERIRNLMADRGTPELALEVDDPELADRLTAAIDGLLRDGDALGTGIGRTVARNLLRMGGMGQAVVDHLRDRLPELPLRAELGGAGDPWAHLPPLPPLVASLAERFASEAHLGAEPASGADGEWGGGDVDGVAPEGAPGEPDGTASMGRARQA
ncbi:MAG TPA: polysaccharide pyruvyl transferase family protein [Polyangiaceae bacterium LLY-WYZ-14_1]|nr:polysaccharide pyruvyl transferase family protein [Polyangiaceae bacterium LLY-WYZ-14_1]